MATAKPQSKRSKRLRILLLLAALVLGSLAFFWRPLNSYAVTGASYGARVACSCRFAGGRDLADCRKDFEAGMALVTLSEDKEDRSVTARFPLLSSQTARYREGQGCVLEPWSN